jgi:hypothetical protein
MCSTPDALDRDAAEIARFVVGAGDSPLLAVASVMVRAGIQLDRRRRAPAAEVRELLRDLKTALGLMIADAGDAGHADRRGVLLDVLEVVIRSGIHRAEHAATNIAAGAEGTLEAEVGPCPVSGPCPCGSGKPFSDCHGADRAEPEPRDLLVLVARAVAAWDTVSAEHLRTYASKPRSLRDAALAVVEELGEQGWASLPAELRAALAAGLRT